MRPRLTPLFEPERHERCDDVAWDAARARSAIDAIVERTHAARTDAGWPVHPLDDEPPGSPTPMLYFGRAGVVWALEDLARRAGTRPPSPDDVHALDACALEAAEHGARRADAPGSLLMGATGVRLVQFRLTREPALLDRIAALVAQNVDHPAREIVWGSPGTALAALWLHEETGQARWADLFVRSAKALLASLVPHPSAAGRSWQQHLYGLRLWMLGAGHGLASNAYVLLRGRHLLEATDVADLERSVVETIVRTARSRDGHTNWQKALPPVEPAEHEAAIAPTRMLVQFCHGAPGIVITLAPLLFGHDDRLDAQLLAAGALTWEAGPLRKGSGLCHGTAGNGHALLALAEASGDAIWLDRARRFAMHVVARLEADRREGVRGRFSLWTGDLGTACFLLDCIEARARFPTLHAFF